MVELPGFPTGRGAVPSQSRLDGGNYSIALSSTVCAALHSTGQYRILHYAVIGNHVPKLGNVGELKVATACGWCKDPCYWCCWCGWTWPDQSGWLPYLPYYYRTAYSTVYNVFVSSYSKSCTITTVRHLLHMLSHPSLLLQSRSHNPN